MLSEEDYIKVPVSQLNRLLHLCSEQNGCRVYGDGECECYMSSVDDYIKRRENENLRRDIKGLSLPDKSG